MKTNRRFIMNELLNIKEATELLRKNKNRFYTYCLWRMDKQEIFYVGKGSNNRALSHARNRKTCNTYKDNIISKVGKENIRFSIEFHDSEKEAFGKEIEKIALYKSSICNLTTGGEGGVPCEESRQKMRKAKVGYKPDIIAVMKGWTKEARKTQSELQKTLTRNYSPESRAKLAWRKGTKDSHETCEKKKASWTEERKKAQAERTKTLASRLTEEQKTAKSIRMIGNKISKGKPNPKSEETKKKISESLKGNVISSEQRQKISQSLKGRVFSEETRRKISDKIKQKWRERNGTSF
jgi:flagellar biosynthesis GTPase FlhF